MVIWHYQHTYSYVCNLMWRKKGRSLQSYNTWLGQEIFRKGNIRSFLWFIDSLFWEGLLCANSCKYRAELEMTAIFNMLSVQLLSLNRGLWELTLGPCMCKANCGNAEDFHLIEFKIIEGRWPKAQAFWCILRYWC